MEILIYIIITMVVIPLLWYRRNYKSKQISERRFYIYTPIDDNKHSDYIEPDMDELKDSY